MRKLKINWATDELKKMNTNRLLTVRENVRGTKSASRVKTLRKIETVLDSRGVRA